VDRVIFLAVIGVSVAVRRMVAVVPVILHGYRPPRLPANPVAAQFAALDDLFAHYLILTLIHIVPGLLFMILGPLQFSRTLRARYPRFHRVNGRIFVACAAILGISALLMSLGMPSIGGVNQAAATTLFATFFLFALGRACAYIRRRQIALHREWMMRAFGTRARRRDDPAHYRLLLCYQPPHRNDTPRILRYRLLARLHPSADGRRSLDSIHSTVLTI
jgi:uncharacterized membrane protein